MMTSCYDFFVNSSYNEDSSLQQDYKQGQSVNKPTIVTYRHLDIVPEFTNVVTVNLDTGNETPGTFDREQLASLVSECCTQAYGSGHIGQIEHTSCPEIAPNMEESTEMTSNMELSTASPPAQDAQQLSKADKKKKVQFSDTQNNNGVTKYTDEQIKPLAACTVSAAMVGAAAEHLSRTGNTSPAGGRAASATAKVAHAVATGNADHAVKAMNEVVKIVDSVTANQQENEFETMPKSKTCVIL